MQPAPPDWQVTMPGAGQKLAGGAGQQPVPGEPPMPPLPPVFVCATQAVLLPLGVKPAPQLVGAAVPPAQTW
jgi:hypothetical protein